MTGKLDFEGLLRVMGSINESIGNLDEQEKEPPIEFYKLFPGFIVEPELVKPLKEKTPELHKTLYSEIIEWDDPYERTYGLDASSTRSMSLDSGEIVTASVGKIGVHGQDPKGIGDYSTVNAVIHSANEDFDVINPDDSDLDKLQLDLFRFPSVHDQRYQIRSWVQDTSLIQAEFKHAYQFAEKLENPLLIDGPLYSGSPFYWLLRHQLRETVGVHPKKTPFDYWEGQITSWFEQRLGTIEEMWRNRVPIVGIVKNPSSSAFLSSLEYLIREDADHSYKTQDIRWTNDASFFTELLKLSPDETIYSQEGKTISYTSWFVEEKKSVSGEAIVPFKDYGGISLEKDPEDYRLAFFYIRVPNKGNVYRVEVPYLMAEKPTLRRNIQKKIVKEVGHAEDAPTAIRVADDRARISNEQRDFLKKELNMRVTDSYNEHRGYTN